MGSIVQFFCVVHVRFSYVGSAFRAKFIGQEFTHRETQHQMKRFNVSPHNVIDRKSKRFFNVKKYKYMHTRSQLSLKGKYTINGKFASNLILLR